MCCGQPARRSPRKWDLVNEGGAAQQPGELLKPLHCNSAWGEASSFCWCICRKRNLLACGWTDLQRLLSSALVERGASCCGGNTFLHVYVMAIWTTCSCVAMAMKEEFRLKLTMMSVTSCSLPHSEETPKRFCCSSLKWSVMISFLNPPEEDTILFALISILSLLTI